VRGGADAIPRRLLFSLLAVAGVLVLAEGVLGWADAFATARAALGAPGRAERSHVRYDAALGWAHAPSVFVPDAFGRGKHLTTNARGFRAAAELAHGAPPGRKRVLFVGDSFTMGHGVGDADTFPAQLERREPRIQSANLAMSGYGVDQAWLSLRSAPARIEKHAIVLAFIAHDFQRMELDFHLAPKPRLALRGGVLEIENAPVPRRGLRERARGALRGFLGELALARALEPALRALASRRGGDASEAKRAQRFFPPLARAVFADLARQSARDGVPVLLAYLPTRGEAERGASALRDWTRSEAARHALAYVDATPSLARAADVGAFYLADGHLSEAGNAAVATALLPALRALLRIDAGSPPGP
jgi:hypothetical protein